MTRLYEREIKDFFEVAKIKMAGTSKDGKGKFGKTTIKTSYYIFQVCLSGNSLKGIFVHAISSVSVCLVFAMLCVCNSVCVLFVIYMCFFLHVTPHDKHSLELNLNYPT